MLIEFLPHAKVRILERGLPEDLIKDAVLKPEQLIITPKRTIIHKRYINSRKNKEYLLRIFVEERKNKKIIVSVYRTSKLRKYWRRDNQ